MELTTVMEPFHHGNILSAARKEPLTDPGADPTLLVHHIPSPENLPLDQEVAGKAALGSPERDGH